MAKGGRRRAHTVAAVGFTEARAAGIPSTRAGVDCRCGWSGVVADWNQHAGTPAAGGDVEDPGWIRTPFVIRAEHQRTSSS